MRLSSLLLPLSLLSTAIAHISGITPAAANYHATAHSKYNLTFETTESPDTSDNFSVVFGVRSVLDYWEPTVLGNPFFYVDLVALGKETTGEGSFSISIPLNTTTFFDGAGTYGLIAAVTSAFGAGPYAELQIFNATLTVTT